MRISEIKLGQRYLVDRRRELCGGEMFPEGVELSFIVFAHEIIPNSDYVKVAGFIGKTPRQQYFKTVMHIKCFVEKVKN